MGFFANGAIVEQISTTATAGGTTSLTATSHQVQQFTGSLSQTVQLPPTTTMYVGQSYSIFNSSTGVVTMEYQDASSFTLAPTVSPSSWLVVKLISTGTTNGTWVVETAGGSGTGGINYITYNNAEAGTTGWRTLNWEQTVTVTIASPAVFTVTATAGMYVGMPISFTTTGALPTGLTASTTYYVSNVLSGTTFRVSATLGGADVNTSGTQSGTHTSYPLVPINDTTVALANLAFASSSSSPLIGVNSYTLTQTNSKAVGGEGVGYDFTIDPAYEGQPLGISFNYNATSTFVASSGLATSASDIEVAIWDVTNGVLIPVTPKVITANGANNFIFSGTFQAASNSTSYTLVLYTPTMNANATGWVFKWDNVSVSPSTISIASSGIVAAAYYASASGTVSTTQTLNFDTKLYDTAGSVTPSAAGTGTWKFTAPTSGLYSINGTMGTTSQHYFSVYKNGTQFMEVGTTVGVSTTNNTIAFNIQLNAGDFIDIRTDSSSTYNGGSLTGADTSSKIFIYLIPNSQISIGAGGSIAITRVSGATGSTTSANIYKFPNTDFDTTASYSASTGQYTVPFSGYCRVSAGYSASNASITDSVYVNGSVTKPLAISDTVVGSAFGSTVVKVNAGDLVDSRPSGTNSPGANSWCVFEMISSNGSSTLNANTSVNARYYASSTSISGSLATVVWTTKDFDSANGMSSGLYTIPVAGKYQVNSALSVSGTFALNGTLDLQIQKNSTVVVEDNVIAGGAETSMSVNCSDIINCLAGDVIRVQIATSASGPAIVSSNSKNIFSIARVGN